VLNVYWAAAGFAPEMEFLLPRADGLDVVAVLGAVAPESVLCGCVTAEEPVAELLAVLAGPGLLIDPDEPVWPVAGIALLLELGAAAPVVPGAPLICAKATAEKVAKARPAKLTRPNCLRLMKCFILYS
jgi:hypothetical protein